ncbi:MAG: hypothetical protein P1U40_08635 [Coxiellaceae bacterium]|nr:hypothetical protein [Coxiellaceae bacterium]
MSRMRLPLEHAVRAAQEAEANLTNALARIPESAPPTTATLPMSPGLFSVLVDAYKDMKSGQKTHVRERLQRLIAISHSLALHFGPTNHRIDVDSITTVCAELPAIDAIMDNLAAHITGDDDDKDVITMQAQAAYNTVVGFCGIIQDSYEAEDELEPEAPTGGGQGHAPGT